MKKLVFTAILFLTCFFVMAQNQTDSIQVTKSLGVVFKQDGKKLNARQMLTIMKDNPPAYQQMKKAKTNLDVGNVFGFIGGALIGYTLGTAVGGKKANWAVAGVGAGVIGIAIPFSIGYSKRARNAVELYNAGLKEKTTSGRQIKIGFTSDGIGLAMGL